MPEVFERVRVTELRLPQPAQTGGNTVSGHSIRALYSFVILLAIGILASLPVHGFAMGQEIGSSGSSNTLRWQSPAKLHHGFRAAKGTLIFNNTGIEFHSDNPRFSHRWSYVEVKTLDMTPRRLVITGYENRNYHIPGDRQYHFTLSRRMSPAVAAQLADLVGKPVINGDPGSHGEDFATIPARHRTLTGGTNGALRFSKEGIAYVTIRGKGGRNWRWTDIQTLAHPDPYHFTVGGYRETFDFELKRRMSQALFDRLWDHQYGRGLQLGIQSGQIRNRSDFAQTRMDDER